MKRLLLVLITLTLLVGSSALQGQAKNFTLVWDGGLGGVDPDGAGPLPPNLIRAWAVFGTDIDNDGNNEFVSYDATNKRILVWETDGDDSYAIVWHKDKNDAQGQTTLYGVERSIMITDLDGDGNLELTMIWDSFDPDSTNGFNALEIYEHDPASGQFLPDTPTLTYDPPRNSNGLVRLEFMSVATDVDGDGVDELILTHRGGSNILLSIISLPGKDFASPDWVVEYVDSSRFGMRVHSMSVGDPDGDGKQDMLVQIDGEDQPIIVYTATAANTYTSVMFDASMYHADYRGSAAKLVMADINGDGNTEVYLGARGGNIWVVSGITDIATAFNAANFSLIADIPAFEGRPTEGVELRGGEFGDADNNGKNSFYVTARDTYEAIYGIEWVGGTGDVKDPDNHQMFNLYQADTFDGVTTGFVALAIGDYDGDGVAKQDIVFVTGNGNEGVAAGIYLVEFNATPLPDSPSAPANLTASPFNGRVTLTWSANSEADFLRYRVYGGTSPGPTSQVDSTTVGINNTTKTITGLSNGTTYYYRVTAVDLDFRESDYSNEVSATPLNSPPVAAGDNANTPEDTPVTIAVLTNDSDVDGDPLSVLSVTQGSNGAVVIYAADSSVTYTPSANFFGADSFEYVVSDGALADTATVTITVGSVNDPPVLAGLPDLFFNEDDSTQIDLDQYVSDVDHDTTGITFTAAVIGAAAQGPIQVSTNPGEFRIDVGTGDLVISIDAASHVATFTVSADSSGSFTVVFTATDDSLAADTDTLLVTVAPENDTPVAVDDAAATPQDNAVTIFVLANDSDVEGDPLTVTGITQGSHGSVAIAAGDTSVTYTPSQGYNGRDSFTYQVSDGAGGLDTATVHVTIGTEAPHIIRIVDVHDDQGRQVYVSWNRSYVDLDEEIIQYGIKLQNPEGTWVSLGTVTAEQAEVYIYLADTFDDSTASGLAWSRFQVTAYGDPGDDYYPSPVDSGYSIDNLAPMTPSGLMASVADGLAVSLTWNGPVDHDFDFFRLYRMATVDTTASSLVETSETSFTDTTVEASQSYEYWLTAVDVNGNESDQSQALSVTVLGLEGVTGVPTAFAIHPAYPNPFNPSTTISYDLPQAGPVALVVYDLRGREVARLVEGQREAGYHQVTWAGRDAAGREVPTGIYIARLSAQAYTKSIKMVMMK